MSKFKPDQYMPFFGNDFFAAVEGYSAVIVAAYLRAIWHYWHQMGCKGLRNDELYLRNICRVDSSEWPEVQQVLFYSGHFFKNENGLWQQKRAKEIYQKQMATIEANRAKTDAARNKRWAK